MTTWTCLQIDVHGDIGAATQTFLGATSLEETRELLAEGRYSPALAIELPDDMSDAEACEAVFLAGNHEGQRTSGIVRLARCARSVSVGDIVRNERTGALYICRNFGWEALPDPAARRQGDSR